TRPIRRAQPARRHAAPTRGRLPTRTNGGSTMRTLKALRGARRQLLIDQISEVRVSILLLQLTVRRAQGDNHVSSNQTHPDRASKRATQEYDNDQDSRRTENGQAEDSHRRVRGARACRLGVDGGGRVARAADLPERRNGD